MQGADVSSDPHLLVMTLGLHLKKYATKKSMRTRCNVANEEQRHQVHIPV
jgi:hypothetical protein